MADILNLSGSNGDEKNTIGERSIYTQNIVDRFVESKVGEIVTYEELSRVIGMNVRPGKQGYSYLSSAIKIVERENSIVMDNVQKVGYKHQEDETVAESSMSLLRKNSKSVSRRMKNRLATLSEEWDSLSHEAKTKAVATSTLIAMNEHTLKAKNIARLTKGVSGDLKVLGFDKTIELFEK
jgi:hypothetical protein